MGTLVRTLVGAEIQVGLRSAYLALAQAYLRHRGGTRLETSDGAEPQDIDHLVCGTEEPIDLRDTRKECAWINTDFERPVEVFNNLGHLFVLLETVPLLASQGFVSDVCAPTQQSRDSDGVAVPDLSGKGWALEAFGGVNIANNAKLARDLRSLWGFAPRRALLACRRIAWPPLDRLPLGQAIQVRATCKKKHGGMFDASAVVLPFARSDGVLVVEMQGITVSEPIGRKGADEAR